MLRDVTEPICIQSLRGFADAAEGTMCPNPVMRYLYLSIASKLEISSTLPYGSAFLSHNL